MSNKIDPSSQLKQKGFVSMTAERVHTTAQKKSFSLMLVTAFSQYNRFFHGTDDNDEMSRTERVVRIIFSSFLLIGAKFVSLATPLYLCGLIEKGIESDLSTGSPESIKFMIQTSAIGLMIGYGTSRIASGFILLISELILGPATSYVAEILPRETFTVSLRCSNDGSYTNEAILSTGESKSNYARRILDRGLRASNKLLNRSLFGLLPSIVEGFLLVLLLFRYTDRVVGLTATTVVYTFLTLTYWIMQHQLKIIKKLREDESVANGYAEDALSLADTVAAFGAYSIEEKRYSHALHDMSLRVTEAQRTSSFLKLIQCIILGIGYIALLFAAWWSQSVGGEAGNMAGTLVLSHALFAQLCAPLDQLVRDFQECVLSAEDLHKLEELKRSSRSAEGSREPPKEVQSIYEEFDSDSEEEEAQYDSILDEIRSNPESVFSSRSQQSRTKGNLYFPILQRMPEVLQSKLEVCDLSFAYTKPSDLSSTSNEATDLDDFRVLKSISFAAPYGGYSIGIVGPSGAGKSTLLQVLLGLESMRGDNMYLDGGIYLDGRDLTAYNRIPFFSVVSQVNELFRGLNLMENIRYGTGNLLEINNITTERRDAALHRAALDAQLYPVISHLKDGWQAEVGPHGRLLSTAERQRVCLARALYRQELSGGILLLDEVTSSLDVRAEKIVTNAIHARVKRGATAVVVAGRLSSVQHCDWILVMQDGEIVEQGKHSELVNMSNGWYSESWKYQFNTTPTGSPWKMVN